MKKTQYTFLAALFGAIAGMFLGAPLMLAASDYFDATGIPVQRSAMSSAEFRTEFSSIETGISDKLPALAGNGDEWVRVNAGGTALTSLTGAATITALGTNAATIAAVWTYSADPVLSGIDTATSSEAAIGIAADAGVDLYYNNIKRFSTLATGGVEVISDTSTDTEGRYLLFRHQDGTERATIGHLSDDVFVFKNRIHGGSVMIQAEATGGADINILLADPDGDTVVSTERNMSFYSDGTEIGLFEEVDALGAGSTSLWVYDKSDTVLRHVLVGSDDGCGGGYKCLRVLN